MQRIVPLVVAAMLTAALSGCLAENGGSQSTDTDTTGAGGPGGSMSDPPSADFVIWIDGNETMMGMNGTFEVEAGVNLTLDASASNGTDLMFAWDFGDGNTSGQMPGAGSGGNGTGGNATAGNTTSPGGNTTGPTNTTMAAPLAPGGEWGLQPNQTNSTNTTTSTPSGPMPTDDGMITMYAYGAAGNYTLTLYVTDSAGQTDSMSADLTVAPGGPAPGTVLRTEHQNFKKSNTCAITDGILMSSKTSTFEWVFYANETDGTPSMVQNVTIKGGPTNTKFIGPDGEEIDSGATIEAEGPFAPGKYKVSATSNCGLAASAVNHNLNAYATYVTT